MPLRPLPTHVIRSVSATFRSLHTVRCDLRRICIGLVALLLLGGLFVQEFRIETTQNHAGNVMSVGVLLLVRKKIEKQAVILCQTATNMSSCTGNGTDFYADFDTNWSFVPPKRLISMCHKNVSDPVLVFVPIAPYMFAQRKAVRNTWGSGFDHVIFVLQLRNGHPISEELSKEVNKFGDIFIVRAPAEDSYECLTLKVLAFIRWFRAQCSHGFHYLLKSDHDSYWHAKSVVRLLRSRVSQMSGRGNNSTVDSFNPTRVQEIIGAIQKSAKAIRDPNSKFCTPVESYASSLYPTYASGGPGYLLSREAVDVLVQESERSTAPAPFWLEDVFITGMLVEAAATFNNNSVSGAANTQILHVDSSSIHINKLSPNDLFNNPPLAVHGLTMLQMHQMHCWMRWPAAHDRAKDLHKLGS